MEVMGDDGRLMQEHGRFVVAAARELQARRTLVVAEARAERRPREIEISTSAGGSGA
jgi:hypothetical protein